MPKHLVEQPTVTLNGIDVGADVYNAEILLGRRAPVDVTGLSDTYDQFLVPNIRKWGVRLQYFNNFSGTSETPTGIATVLRQVFNSTATTGVAFVYRSSTGNRGMNNPEWSGQVQLDGDFQALSGGVAEADKGSVTLKGLSTLSYLTSSS
jgi:hypothetical protein